MTTELALLLSASLAAFAAALVFWPLLRRATAPPEDEEAGWSELARLRQERDLGLQAIQDLDREVALGNITPEDHRTLRARYVRQTALLVREIEGREQVLDEEIEQAVRRRRRTPAVVRTGEPGGGDGGHGPHGAS